LAEIFKGMMKKSRQGAALVMSGMLSIRARSAQLRRMICELSPSMLLRVEEY
jgi:hypothetical protein